MQCPNCQFENMPGMNRCARCDAPLASVFPSRDATDYMPPRAGRGKAFRRLLYPLHRASDRGASWRAFPERVFSFLWPSPDRKSVMQAASLLANIIPGLGYLVSRRFAEAALFGGGWACLIALWILFMPTLASGVAFGLAVGVHVIAMLHGGNVRQAYGNALAPMRIALLLLLVLGVLYAAAFRATRRWINFATAPFSVEQLDLLAGDTLRLVPFTQMPEDIAADVCLVERQRQRFGWAQGNYVVASGDYLGLRLASDSDTVIADHDGIRRNGNLVMSAQAMEDMPFHLPPQPIALTVPSESSFVMLPMLPMLRGLADANPYPHAAFEQLYSEIYIVPDRHMRARAVTVHLPFRRRHRLDYASADFTKKDTD